MLQLLGGISKGGALMHHLNGNNSQRHLTRLADAARCRQLAAAVPPPQRGRFIGLATWCLQRGVHFYATGMALFARSLRPRRECFAGSLRLCRECFAGSLRLCRECFAGSPRPDEECFARSPRHRSRPHWKISMNVAPCGVKNYGKKVNVPAPFRKLTCPAKSV